MIHLFINAFAASAGGGLTYIRNTIPILAACEDVRTTVMLSSALRRDFRDPANVEFLEAPVSGGMLQRFWFEQCQLPRVIRRCGANVLLSTGNFALWRSPVPQILLSRNALYTSRDFMRDLRRRGDYAIWMDTAIKAELAKLSIRVADVTVAPSAAFADELRQWTGRQVLAIHHGFDGEAFTREKTPLPREICEKLEGTAGALRLLFVSHYNYYRNFETLLRALPLIHARLAPRPVRLILTCELRSETNPGAYRANAAAGLVTELGVRENVVELGSVPHGMLHHLYQMCDIYVTPAYAESFAHPLVEAMSMGLPVVASDLKVHREICGEAGRYFQPLSPEALSETVAAMATSSTIREDLVTLGRKRAADFSWQSHVRSLLKVAESLLARSGRDTKIRTSRQHSRT